MKITFGKNAFKKGNTIVFPQPSISNHILIVGQTGSGKTTLFKFSSINEQTLQDARKSISELNPDTVSEERILMMKYLHPEKFLILYEFFKEKLILSEMPLDTLKGIISTHGKTNNLEFLLKEQRYDMAMDDINSLLFYACEENNLSIVRTIFQIYYDNNFHRYMPDLFSISQNIENRDLSQASTHEHYWELINYFLYELNIHIQPDEMPFLEPNVQQHVQKRDAYLRLMNKSQTLDNTKAIKRKI